MALIVDEALTKLGLHDDFQVISDIPSIVKHGIMNPPALMINGTVEIEGKLPSVDEVIRVLKKYK